MVVEIAHVLYKNKTGRRVKHTMEYYYNKREEEGLQLKQARPNYSLITSVSLKAANFGRRGA